MKFLWCAHDSLEIVSEGIVRCLAHMVCVFKFIPNVCKHGGCNCSFSSLCILPASSAKNGGQWRKIKCILYMLPKKEMKWCTGRWSRCPGDWAASFKPFLGNCLSKKPQIAAWKCIGWNGLTLGQFFQNQRKKFLQHVLGVLHKSQKEHIRSIMPCDSFPVFLSNFRTTLRVFWQSGSWPGIILRQQALGG